MALINLSANAIWFAILIVGGFALIGLVMQYLANRNDQKAKRRAGLK